MFLLHRRFTYHSEEVRVVNSALFARLFYFLIIQHPRHGQTEVSTEGVDEHRLTNIRRLQQNLYHVFSTDILLVCVLKTWF